LIGRWEFLKLGGVGLAGVALFGVAGCGAEQEQQRNAAQQGQGLQRGGVIKVASDADPPTLDWMGSPSSATTVIAYHVFEQLFALDNDLVARPMLARDYEVSDDLKTYTIRLREGVKFHDGSTMDAEDVVASMERWGTLSGIGMATFEKVQDVRAVDGSTVEVSFKEAFSPLVNNLADPQQSMTVIPAEIAREAGEDLLGEEQLVGTGPFKFGKWKRGQRITLARFDDYVSRDEDWGGLTGRKTPYADEVQFDVVADPQVRMDGMRTGQYHYAIRMPKDSYEQLRSTDGIRPVVTKPDSWITIVPDKAEPPFDDVRLRQAINHALNKEDIARGTYGDPEFYRMDGSIFFPEQKALYTTEGTDLYDAYDPERARQLMREAGYDGEPLTLMVTNSFDDHFNSAQIEVEQLKEVGFNIDIQTYEWATFLERVEDPKNFDLFVTGFPPAYDPTTVLWFPESFPGWWQNEEIGRLLDEWAATNDPNEQERLLGEMNRLTYEDVPLVKVVNEIGLEAVSDDLQGYESWLSMRFWNTGVSDSESSY
jgi:peptide/nickel transport system substrate-binding protein